MTATWLLASWLVLAAQAGGERAAQMLQGDARAAFLVKVKERMSRTRSFAAAFEQEKVLAIFKQPVHTEGLIVFQAPEQLRWEIVQPFRSLLVVSGNDVGKFVYENGRRQALKLGGGGDVIAMVMDHIRAWFRGDFAAAAKQYDIDVAEQPDARIRLQPKDPALRANLQSIELALSADLGAVHTVTLNEREGDRTRMRFTELARDVPLRAELFSVTDPAECDRESLRAGSDQPSRR